jgi:hypothetical protein
MTAIIEVYHKLYYIKLVGYLFENEDDDIPYVTINSLIYNPKETQLADENIPTTLRFIIPEDFLETQIRQLLLRLKDRSNVFKPNNMKLLENYLKRETLHYELLKRYTFELKEIEGLMTGFDLKTYLEEYSDEELKNIKIPIKIENLEDTKLKNMEKYIFVDKETNKTKEYITITKIGETYNIDVSDIININ